MFDFGDLHIVVVGDVMLDQYIYGEVNRISPESPIPILEQNKREYKLGGAANVAANVMTLGAKATLLGVVGSDLEAGIMADLTKSNGIDFVKIVDSTRPTTLKTRLVAKNQQLLRVDKEITSDISPAIGSGLLTALENLIETTKVDAIILQDYNKGVLNADILPKLIELAKANTIIVTVDPKYKNIDSYKDAYMLKPNLKEALTMLNVSEKEFFKSPEAYCHTLVRKLGLSEVWITLGEKGILGFHKKGKLITQPTKSQKIIDVCGAGDGVIAILTLLTCQNASFETKAKATNVAGGIVCSQAGVATVSIATFNENFT